MCIMLLGFLILYKCRESDEKITFKLKKKICKFFFEYGALKSTL